MILSTSRKSIVPKNLSVHDNEGSQRSASRAASSHHESWPEGGIDGELVEEEAESPSKPNSARPVSSRRSRQSSARRSASLKERSRSHISGDGVDETGEGKNDISVMNS